MAARVIGLRWVGKASSNAWFVRAATDLLCITPRLANSPKLAAIVELPYATSCSLPKYSLTCAVYTVVCLKSSCRVAIAFAATMMSRLMGLAAPL